MTFYNDFCETWSDSAGDYVEYRPGGNLYFSLVLFDGEVESFSAYRDNPENLPYMPEDMLFSYGPGEIPDGWRWLYNELVKQSWSI